MPECTFIELCPMLNTRLSGVSPAEAEDYRRRYCRADRFACARYLVATSVGQEKVPPDLSPDESDKALKIVRAAG